VATEHRWWRNSLLSACLFLSLLIFSSSAAGFMAPLLALSGSLLALAGATILRLLRVLPAYPIFGDSRTRLQPAYADDVAAAITQVLRQSKKPYPIYELVGPRVYSYEELLRTIARTAGLRPVLMRMPFALWDMLAGVAEILPRPPLTRNQVELYTDRHHRLGQLAGVSRARHFAAIARRRTRSDAQAKQMRKFGKLRKRPVAHV
jgi:uncharacterized protein YbjT (DUF2867 family)